MNTTLIPLFRAVRRRLRVAWALTTLQLVAPLVALGALGLVLAGRFFDLAWERSTRENALRNAVS